MRRRQLSVDPGGFISHDTRLTMWSRVYKVEWDHQQVRLSTFCRRKPPSFHSTIPSERCTFWDHLPTMSRLTADGHGVKVLLAALMIASLTILPRLTAKGSDQISSQDRPEYPWLTSLTANPDNTMTCHLIGSLCVLALWSSKISHRSTMTVKLCIETRLIVGSHQRSFGDRLYHTCRLWLHLGNGCSSQQVSFRVT